MRATTRKSGLLLGGLAGAVITIALACGGSDEEVISSQAYRGHENDGDIHALVNAYPDLVGTRLDDCQTCHKGGDVEFDSGKQSSMNPCAYCHLITYPDEGIVSGAPTDWGDTLNPYGLAYLDAGRDKGALKDIGGDDSDGDSFANDDEIAALRYPGDADSFPGQPTVPIKTFSWEEIGALDYHEEFLLMNSHKQEFDFYATYGGTKVVTLLEAAGADLDNAESITFIAPDGYMIDMDISLVKNAFPAGLYYANLDPGSFSDPDQGFVEYPPEGQMPSGLTDGGEIPGEQWLLLAYKRDGADLANAYLDPTSGRLEEEGSYRNIVPQAVPGAPDRGSNFSPSEYDDGYDYDENKDHNAGNCVRGLVAIRVNPMPEGYEEFDWKNGGFSLIEKQQLIVYGAGITE